MSTQDHLVAQVTDRGFKHLPEVATTYGGTVKVYESSAANEPHVWLVIDGIDAARAHLTVEAARQVAEQLLHTIANHYQNEGGEQRG